MIFWLFYISGILIYGTATYMLGFYHGREFQQRIHTRKMREFLYGGLNEISSENFPPKNCN